MVDDTDPEEESDLRRRAAWLLAMLAVVAVLLAIVITAVAGNGGGDKKVAGTGPLDGEATRSQSSSPNPRQSATRSATHSRSRATSSAPVIGHGSCPTQETCILDGDVGNGVQAINDYRTAHNRPAVPGEVTRQAQTCALHNGSGCSGGWAETELSTPDAAEAVKKMVAFAKWLDRDLTSIEVGWAYDPHAKLYYFAIVRND